MSRYLQRDVTDCGAACFVYICDHYRLRLPLARVRRELGTNQTGTTAAGLVAAAQRLGFSAKGVKGSPEALASVPLPAIAHCLTERKLLHYVVLVDWTPKRARIMDPALGRVETWAPEKFKATWTGVLVLLSPTAEFRRGDATVSPWRRFWQLLQPHRSVMVQSLAGALVATFLGLGTSIYVQKIVDAVIPDRNAALLNLLGVAMLVVLGLKLALGWLQSLLSLRTAQRIDAALILAYYRHLLELPQPFFDTMRVGEITSRIGDAVKIRNFLNQSLPGLVLNPLMVTFSLAAMFWWSWKLALLSLSLIPAYALIYALVDRLNRDYQRRVMERGADFDAELVESLQAQPVIRSHGLESDAILRAEKKLVGLLRAAWASALGSCAGASAIAAVTQLYTIGLLWLGARLVLAAEVSPGQLMSCYTLAGYLTGPVTALVGLNAGIQEALIATDRLFEIMDLEREANPGTVDRPPPARAIRFEKVGFRHAGRTAGVTDLNLEFPAGAITALVGPSGCGKSTVLALLQRLYAPESGRILWGDIDLRYFRLESLRQHLAIAGQHTRLQTGTILENLAPGDYAPDFERLVRVCRACGALEFIEQLPHGFLTPLTENGANLSGGQRQRLALARALYPDAPLLVLDEPTSALDPASEHRLVSALQEIRMQGRTVIVATHSSVLLAAADRVFRLERGVVVTGPPGIAAAG